METIATTPTKSKIEYGKIEDIDSVGQYMKEIGRFALLKAEDEVNFAQNIEVGLYAQQLIDASGDEEHVYRDMWEQLDEEHKDVRSLRLATALGEYAWARMIESNTRLVTSIAKKFTGHGLSLQDLIQEGNLGLIHAVEKFDYEKGFKFSTYATPWIDRYIRVGIANHARTIRLPIWVVEQANKMTGAVRSIESESGLEPTSREIAERSGLKEGRVRELQDYLRSPVSLDKPVGSNEDAVLGDFIDDITDIPVEDLAIDADTQKYIQVKIPLILDDLAKTNSEYSEILRLHFGIGGQPPKTTQEIGEIYGNSYQNIQVKIKRALTKLRENRAVRELEGLVD